MKIICRLVKIIISGFVGLIDVCYQLFMSVWHIFVDCNFSRCLFCILFVYLTEQHLDQFLSDEFCQDHYLVGLLLQEVKQGLNVIKEVRKVAIRMLRNLLAKHCFDKRYKGQVSSRSPLLLCIVVILRCLQSHQQRVSTLYLPFISIILENKQRLVASELSLGQTNNCNSTPAPSSLNQSAATESSKSSSLSRDASLGFDTLFLILLRIPRKITPFSNVAWLTMYTCTQDGSCTCIFALT